MDKARRFLQDIKEEMERHYEWTRKWSLISSSLLGLGLSVLVGVVLLSAGSVAPPAAVLLAFSSALLSTALTYAGMLVLADRAHGRRAAVAIRLDELVLLKRAGTTLGSLLFFIARTRFETALGWLADDRFRDARFVIAAAIEQQLDRSFDNDDDDGFWMPISAYADHSVIVAELLRCANNVCFTCIKSPKSWFLDLDRDRIEHQELPLKYRSDGSLAFAPEILKQQGCSAERAEKYPTHFVRFLDKPAGESIRRRAFLLDDSGDNSEWKKLLEPAHYEFFRKFIGPCKEALIETRFVNLTILEKRLSAAAENIAKVFHAARESNITRQDYDIFEGTALLVFEDSASGTRDAGPTLEFKVGDRVKKYHDFVTLIFSGSLGQEHGVFTPEEIEGKILEAAQLSATSLLPSGQPPAVGAPPAAGTHPATGAPPAAGAPLAARAPSAAGAPPASKAAPPDV